MKSYREDFEVLKSRLQPNSEIFVHLNVIYDYLLEEIEAKERARKIIDDQINDHGSLLKAEDKEETHDVEELKRNSEITVENVLKNNTIFNLNDEETGTPIIDTLPVENKTELSKKPSKSEMMKEYWKEKKAKEKQEENIEIDNSNT